MGCKSLPRLSLRFSLWLGRRSGSSSVSGREGRSGSRYVLGLGGSLKREEVDRMLTMERAIVESIGESYVKRVFPHLWSCSRANISTRVKEMMRKQKCKNGLPNSSGKGWT
ncbi:hypothetical protein TNIN_218791 [Trichonephila inaurata madagascariensis]|uniref:Uncharacterized protein n=1 Tax=Trichonephila inaurata madagascariensis TaxID=2747483 RepID=A0A8X6WZA2_9ARAC|nr:hypothetical protein TNIN_218791 [Trichonephila inaurata madagascariensis]